jgi:hypothetical protein
MNTQKLTSTILILVDFTVLRQTAIDIVMDSLVGCLLCTQTHFLDFIERTQTSLYNETKLWT